MRKRPECCLLGRHNILQKTSGGFAKESLIQLGLWMVVKKAIVGRWTLVQHGHLQSPRLLEYKPHFSSQRWCGLEEASDELVPSTSASATQPGESVMLTRPG